jgi:hypothetical protein
MNPWGTMKKIPIILTQDVKITKRDEISLSKQSKASQASITAKRKFAEVLEVSETDFITEIEPHHAVIASDVSRIIVKFNPAVEFGCAGCFQLTSKVHKLS